jgi:hypothetical protein
MIVSMMMPCPARLVSGIVGRFMLAGFPRLSVMTAVNVFAQRGAKFSPETV